MLGSTLFGQSGKEAQLAAQYVQSGEYAKALPYYEKLFDKQPGTFYASYFQCLIGLKDFDKAEKIAKKAIKSGNNPVYYIDLGYIYELKGEKSKANNQYDKAIKELGSDMQKISAVANSFINRNLFDYAIEAYLKGRKELKGVYTYNFELADLYGRKQDVPHMIAEYLDILLINETYLSTVQNILQANLANDPSGKKSEEIRELILKKVQQEPDRAVFAQLLSWVYIQQKDFEMAFNQQRALDKRFNENGNRLMQLAEICLESADYETASKCYEYVMSKGKSGDNYLEARMGLLKSENKRITSKFERNITDLLKLEEEYKKAIEELGHNTNTVQLIRGLAHLQAFFLDKKEDAIKNLDDIIKLPGVNKFFQAECKIELGDILLIKGDIWESTLLYSQVDLDFKGAPIGEEAKLKNSRLSYYTGEFEFAKAQLDVLKSGTSHLIANDAMALSLLISDNIDLTDSNTTPLMMYARAELAEYQHKDELCISILDSIQKQFPAHSLADEILYKKASIMERRGDYKQAVVFLNTILEKYPEDILADDALYDLAVIFDQKLNDPAKAKELYQRILEKYPSSLYVAEARKRIRVIRGDKVDSTQ